MSENQKYPYDDDLMRFDKDLNQYLLTESALLKFGVDIRARLSATAGISPENEINYAVYRVSNLIYGYIHEHNANNAFRELQEAILKGRLFCYLCLKCALTSKTTIYSV